MEALMEVQRWLFSSLFYFALSLSFLPSLPFSSVLPELLSSQTNSLHLFFVLPSFSKILSPGFLFSPFLHPPSSLFVTALYL